MNDRIVSSCYHGARNGEIQVEGFPDFDPLLQEMKAQTQEVTQASGDYKVTACLPSGALVVKPGFFEQFKGQAGFQELVDNHDSRYNKDKISLVEQTSSVADKKLTEMVRKSEDGPIPPERIATLPSPDTLQINSQISLIIDTDHEAAFFKADTSEEAILPDRRELFSFGGGSWFDGADAKEILDTRRGKYLRCALTVTSLVILESKRLPAHLASLNCIEKPVELQSLLRSLEDAGEACCS
ncbi:unnamed protein product [Durusdinium trenchii]|uniref:Uncharacterized protein n=1 Tax=Durusdinium trenchii TaxID=1381693 RepID=A0ABP0N5A1_9DINO